jgi:hypothetical protein
MSLRTVSMVGSRRLEGQAVFLSASIPNPDRWDGEFDALEITDAVVAASRSVLTAGGVLVTAAHPTIAPLLLYVAAEFPTIDEPRVIVFQSRLFSEVLPRATQRFEDQGVGLLRWTDAVAGETPQPGNWDESLDVMRRTMLGATNPAAAIFIGGMDGISDELRLFSTLYPGNPVYPLGRPGGEARRLAELNRSSISELLLTGDVYPTLFRLVIEDLAAHIENRR